MRAAAARPVQRVPRVKQPAYHRPLCRQQLKGYEALFDRFSALGVEVIAVSTNEKDIATKTKSEWKLPIGHSLSLDTVRD